MNSPSVQAEFPSEKTGAYSWPWALLGLAVCFVAISSQSLWIDEAFMAGKASQPTLADWWRLMPKGNGSDLQMPLYMIYMWGFAKIFGLGEWTLRAANIPWFVAGVAAFVPAFPKPQRFAAAAVTLLCPFAWFYLNEARPYAMQLGASLLVFAALYRLSGCTVMEPRAECIWVAAFWVGILVLCGSSLLGVIWSGAAFLGTLCLFSLERLRQLLRMHWLACLLSCVLLGGLAGYYLWTVKSGMRSLDAADQQGGNLALTAVKSAAHFRQGFAGGSQLQSLAYLFYELLGFTGLGPGKLQIRAVGLPAFRHYAPRLAAYAVSLFPLFLLAASRLMRHSRGLSPKPRLDCDPLNRSRLDSSPSLLNGDAVGLAPGTSQLSPEVHGMGRLLALAVVILLPLVLLLLAGYFLGFLVLGRHCTPLMPVLFFVLSLGLVSAGLSRRAILKFFAIAFLTLSLFSCLSLRFAARHAKDDYRDAAQAATAALIRGQTVWWSAADDGAAYYHLPLAIGPGEAGRALLVLNPTPQSLITLPAPDLVITSKPDLYDNQEALAKYVRNNPYTQIAAFPAFALWERKSAPINQ